MIICLKYRCCSVDGDKDVTLGDGKQLQQYIIQAVKSDAAYLIIPPTHTHFHTPSIAFRHLPPNSARFGNATEGALFISTQLSTDAVSTLQKVPVLTWLWKQSSAQAPTQTWNASTPCRKNKSSVSIQTILVLFELT